MSRPRSIVSVPSSPLRCGVLLHPRQRRRQRVPWRVEAGRLRFGAPILCGPFLDPLNRRRQRDPCA
jgi:hypothetical protein